MVPRQEVHFLDMAIGDAMKLIISGGAVVPPWDQAKASTASTPTSSGQEEAPQSRVSD